MHHQSLSKLNTTTHINNNPQLQKATISMEIPDAPRVKKPKLPKKKLVRKQKRRRHSPTNHQEADKI
jgi:hypothetical protein